MMQAIRREIIPASGVEYATSLKLTPSSVTPRNPDGDSPRVLCNVVVARSNILRVFEVVEEPTPLPLHSDESRSKVRKDTEAVEGEVEMDTQGEGFVNIGAIKSAPTHHVVPTTARLYFLREHRLHGIITGLESLKIMSSEDNLDRLLVSFKDAKIALLEWSDVVHDLITVSIHTYERTPQMLSSDLLQFKAELRVDPNHRCVALSLPKDAVAILPFYQSQTELDMIDQDPSLGKEIPYSPSYVLDFSADVDERIRNVVDFVFLPGFNNPTAAVLFQTQQTWTGRLKEFKDTISLLIFTIDLVTRKYPIITSVDNLPYDCISIIPCAPSLGGVIVMSCNAIIYIDQSTRRVTLPVNGWASRVTDLPLLPLRPDEQTRDLQLESAKAAFIDERTMFVILQDGAIMPVEIVMDGKMVSKLSMGPALAQSTIPSVVRSVNEGHLFIGSTAGPSILLHTMRVEEEVPRDLRQESVPAAVVDQPLAMVLDDDEDIYGDAKETNLPALNGHPPVETRSVIHLSLCDSIPAHGSISDMTFSLTRNGDRNVAELVAATGSGHLGGFTLFQRDLPTRTKRKLHAIGGARGVWSIPVRQSLATNAAASMASQQDYDTVIVSTDTNPSPGLSRIASRTSKNDISIGTRLASTTIGAGPFFQRTAILHVITDAIRVLEPDGTERQVIKDMDGNMKRPKIRYCSISDPFVLILREDDSLGLFVDAGRGKIRRKDMTPMGGKISRYLAACFCSDQSGIFQTTHTLTASTSNTSAVDGQAASATTSVEATVDPNRGTQWLIVCRPQGVLEIWSLPKLSIVFSTPLVATLESVFVDTYDPVTPSVPEDQPRKPQEFDVDQVMVAPMGESNPKPYLLIFLRCGVVAIYEAVRSGPAPRVDGAGRANTLLVQFAKVHSRTFEVRSTDEAEKTVLLEHKRISRNLIPFVTSPHPQQTLSGVFFTGDQPCWILGTDKGGIKIHPCGYSVVHSFTACSIWESRGDFLMYTDEGPCLLEWMPELNLAGALPCRSVPRSRAYTNVTYDPSTGLIVAASVESKEFVLFDEDGNKMWDPEAPNIHFPKAEHSTLELISSDFVYTLDGYEFAENEFVNSVECVTLETQSTESGQKDFLAVGTTIHRGEDLAVKGATYVFEIVEVVPEPNSLPKRRYRLRMHCRDEAKGPVTAVCGLNGYLVSSMGQKIFVRAFDLDERLVGVAFLDVGVYVTSLRTLKNLLLIGDAVKSVWFVAFQEDPFKLVILSKDVQRVCATNADFLFSSEGNFHIVVEDEEGIIRLYDYDPHDPESRNGQHLLCRTEFHAQAESRASVMVACRSRGEEKAIPYARLITGATDGSLSSLTPVDETIFKRMQLLQGQLTRNVQHFAGLNPKAFRVVRNDYVSRPLSKGIVDGNLLQAFEDLSITRQIEITRQIGTVRSLVLNDWIGFGFAW
ncbi:hypothetical protein BD410DRAFT_828742 [Rickenella mellea]|uniref:DNA damage-binding protein 1 n=1 Tax=Rickenella mellea TaxID=50990 RepID=A0A4Y7Q2Z7_9AGAM|nr:hypothetical protein BD410DRAFT_828742 [Rickenella mellea]